MSRVEISYSRLQAYLDCPWLYRLQYVDGKRVPSHPESSLGRSLHRTLAAFHREGGSTLERILDLYEDHWMREGFSSPKQQAAYYERGVHILRRFWDLEFDRKSRVLHVEKDFEFPLGPYRVRGTIDRIDERPDGTLEVIDYKSLQEPMGEEGVRQNLQLRIYGLACRKALGFRPDFLSIFYLSRADQVSVPYEEGGESWILDLLKGTAGRIASGDFIPNPRHCPACPFRRSCRYSVLADALV